MPNSEVPEKCILTSGVALLCWIILHILINKHPDVCKKLKCRDALNLTISNLAGDRPGGRQTWPATDLAGDRPGRRQTWPATDLAGDRPGRRQTWLATDMAGDRHGRRQTWPESWFLGHRTICPTKLMAPTLLSASIRGSTVQCFLCYVTVCYFLTKHVEQQ